MAKRKVRKANFIGVVLFAVMCVLAVLNFALPLLTSQGGASGIGSTEKTSYGLFGMLDGMSDKAVGDLSDAGRVARTRFFLDDEKTQAKWFTVLSLVTAIVGCIGIVLAVVSLVVPKLYGYIKYVGALLALIAIVTFVFAIVCTNVYSSSASLGITTIKSTVELAIGSILSLVGGLGAVAVPFVCKK